MAATIDPGAFDVLTFDCYGTLIDWETGLLGALRVELAGAVDDVSDEDLLEAFAAVEHAAQVPYQPYRDVLAQALREVGARYGAAPSAEQQARFGGSVPDWPAFPDSSRALARLQQRYRLAPITNCDDDLFAGSAARLGASFPPNGFSSVARSRSLLSSSPLLRALKPVPTLPVCTR